MLQSFTLLKQKMGETMGEPVFATEVSTSTSDLAGPVKKCQKSKKRPVRNTGLFSLSN
ncbi:hypothetical protein HMPREF3213_00124 [Heyndrickxia coagulans]|uniref:Uncharacterized protein n=1 Tax=Heyndrickxia coagulans TaxID=1398 RepID=A0A133L2J8_HEYCO|nr:hypothetical protein HMPREF3213_00124 [Heyndrickxia coagulans]